MRKLIVIFMIFIMCSGFDYLRPPCAKYSLRRICAWCKKDMGISLLDNPVLNGDITHTICSECSDRMLEKEALTRKIIDAGGQIVQERMIWQPIRSEIDTLGMP